MTPLLLNEEFLAKIMIIRPSKLHSHQPLPQSWERAGGTCYNLIACGCHVDVIISLILIAVVKQN